MQGYWTYNARKPSSGDVPSEMIDHYLIDTCWVWRKGGPRVKMLRSSKVQEVMSKIYSKVGYCNCGYEIWIEYLPNANKWIYRFFDMDHNEITECPACGNELNEDDLESM